MSNRRLPAHRPKRRPSSGATLIEILVALLVLSMGVLGMAAMQIRALKGNHSSMQRTQAVIVSYYILDAMRVDKDSAKSLNYNTGSNGAVIGEYCDPDAANGTSLAKVNVKHWIQTLKSTIGEASDTTTCGAIYCDANGLCRVQVRWDDTRAGGLGVQLVETQTNL